MNRATPSAPLTVLRADSEQERAALDEAFVGVTINGKVRPDLYTLQATGVSTAPLVEAVRKFRSALTDEQRAASRFPLEGEEWRRWTNIDIGNYKRQGVGLNELTPAQQELGLDILRSGLSHQGYRKTEDIRQMEGYLARLTGEFELLGPDLYWFSFMGEPSETEPWGWQFDGHHLVINYFVVGDQVVMTPTFLGSEPNYIQDGEGAGTRTFAKEEALGVKLYKSLDQQQRAAATLYDRKEASYIQANAFRDNAVVPITGVRVSTFSSAQRAILNELLGEYVGNMAEGHARVKLAEVKQHLPDTWFAWVGDVAATGPFYYRIQSPVILIEFDHQRPIFLEGDLPTRAHVHTLVRTPNGNDYGKDLLGQHLAEHPH
ncbi:hypothetical protein GGR26_003521 [Lewinella marina]|uniref:DUF3500 domain-containing protein n=1 Tax=Neolewinella marina TaxID=438751 RepID=A0A2G0CB39_9BACT|nr:DUF3500 domain-containing protein [Neolewinella marina]NJB87735.1 hypothetical protein [Neolewinella marina]PHK97209.1 hypothetical protein CGL56_16645 [Neolewinella marina]